MKQSLNIPAGKFAGEGYQEYAGPKYNERQRNGFVTFWLWLGIVCSVISGIIVSIAMSSYSNLGYYGIQLTEAGVDYSHAASQLEDASIMLVITNILAAICNLIGYIMLLKWKKAGFWLIIVATVVVSSMTIYAMGLISEAYSEIGLYLDSTITTITQVGGTFIGWIILWAILQIKKNGISCWRQLD
ncbi:MAG: hypothetical protein HDS77_09330 [Bacteroidales bacterium]|nr:hypothetical protein [Bacteroidales bacterium]